MKWIAFFIVLISLALFFAGCRKNNSEGESILYGTWVKGSNFGDTLWFMRKNNQDILRQAESFNAGLVVYSEKEYRFRNGKLEIKLFYPPSQDYYPIDSFTWIQAGSEFKIQGIQLYIFMSSAMTYFNFRKL
jgi:hypothetical protein